MTQEEAAKKFIEVYKKSKFVSLLDSGQKLELIRRSEKAPTVVLLEAINYIKSRDKMFKDIPAKKERKKEDNELFGLINEINALSQALKKKYNIT